MSLQPIDYINGISSLIYVSVSIIVGLIILSHYFQKKNRIFLLMGLTWMGMSEPWLPSGISFLSNLITGKGLPLELYAIIGNLLIPASVLCWLIAFTQLICPKKQHLILSIYVIIGILFEIIFFLLLFINPSAIGVFSAGSSLVHIDIEYKTFILAYLLFIDVTMLITGIFFARESLTATTPELKLKGKFLLLAFLAWCIGGLVDSALPLNLITLPITRILLVLSGILFYFGFILPPGIKNIFLK
jgi:hypothetical protein